VPQEPAAGSAAEPPATAQGGRESTPLAEVLMQLAEAASGPELREIVLDNPAMHGRDPTVLCEVLRGGAGQLGVGATANAVLEHRAKLLELLSRRGLAALTAACWSGGPAGGPGDLSGGGGPADRSGGGGPVDGPAGDWVMPLSLAVLVDQASDGLRSNGVPEAVVHACRMVRSHPAMADAPAGIYAAAARDLAVALRRSAVVHPAADDEQEAGRLESEARDFGVS